MTRTRSIGRAEGFTLVELVVAITISSLLIGMIGMIMGAPVDRYVEQSRRNELVSVAERIERRLSTDLDTALPNSVRVRNFANTSVLQLLVAKDVVFYHESVMPADPVVELSFTTPGDTFRANGPFSESPLWLVVNNEGIPNRDAYELLNVITRNAVTVNSATSPVAITDGTFAFASNPLSTNRMFGVTGPITYVCNRATGILRRFEQHAIDRFVPADESAPELSSAGTLTSIVATGVSGCNLQCQYKPGSYTCRNTVTFDITVTRGAAPDDENIRLLNQFAVENAL
jgi:prepilin-type N-terminal cleavage/methylation domain-containing protein